MNFLIRSLYWTIYTTIVLCCNPGEYAISNVCCPMCPPGQVVSVHCTVSTSSTVCIPCVAGTYMDHPNGLTECFRCKECDTGAGLQVKTKCTYTSDTVCECSTGYFCLGEDSECDLCQQHTRCEPGQFVKAPGTRRTNTVCEDCPSGHFSNESMSVTCTQWTKCTFLGLQKPGTTKSDSTCKRSDMRILVVFSCIIIASLMLFTLIKCKQGKQGEEQSPPNAASNKPVQEEGMQ
ncbi:tumor necrosis factor receptor superfamily member 14 [Pseudophryne corroboree]|uniref:tumor necrosis factor receptor superfamily member 14 n=1 Tax=Pseudophryne corroboree TaxID=495146 RepID=UPI00308138D1